ncbi:MAG: hypothetical protein AB7E55_23305 [Pigmentiphaga sp.]
MTRQTLYLLVTCSMDPSRAELAEKVVDNLIHQNGKYHFFPDFLVFDNASTFSGHLDKLPEDVKVVRADQNIGYWSAINWVLGHAHNLMSKEYKYIYIIESDLIHYDMHRLDDCEGFLDANADVGGVRTQKFSVRWRAFYDKGNRFLPFARRDAWVSQINYITGKRVRFRLADRRARIFRCDFLPKLPALNRFQAMQQVFLQLARRGNIVETDFMEAYAEMYPSYAVLDGGVFQMLSSARTTHVSGSYSSKETLAEIDYRPTRVDRIQMDGFTVFPFTDREK